MLSPEGELTIAHRQICGASPGRTRDPITKDSGSVRKSSPTIKPDDANSFRYPGGKGGAGVYQTLINNIPPHDIYIETHLGGGAVMRYKKRARVSIGIDVDTAASGLSIPGIIAINGDATRWLDSNRKILNQKIFVYADPPYLMGTRKGGKLYNFEYTVDQHIDLLNVIRSLPCKVMISGYWSELYAETLADWNCFSFEAQTRRGMATEWVWFNYPDPVELHDYRYLGRDFRERERIKRKIRRWSTRLDRLPTLERAALFQAIQAARTRSPILASGAGRPRRATIRHIDPVEP